MPQPDRKRKWHYSSYGQATLKPYSNRPLPRTPLSCVMFLHLLLFWHALPIAKSTKAIQYDVDLSAQPFSNFGVKATTTQTLTKYVNEGHPLILRSTVSDWIPLLPVWLSFTLQVSSPTTTPEFNIIEAISHKYGNESVHRSHSLATALFGANDEGHTANATIRELLDEQQQDTVPWDTSLIFVEDKLRFVPKQVWHAIFEQDVEPDMEPDNTSKQDDKTPPPSKQHGQHVLQALKDHGATVTSIGRDREGLPFHAHGDALFVLFEGEKKWMLAPPHKMTDALLVQGMIVSNPNHNRTVQNESFRWICQHAFVICFVQQPGDLVYVPAQWWHATSNKAPVAVGYGVMNAYALFSTSQEVATHFGTSVVKNSANLMVLQAKVDTGSTLDSHVNNVAEIKRKSFSQVFQAFSKPPLLWLTSSSTLLHSVVTFTNDSMPYNIHEPMPSYVATAVFREAFSRVETLLLDQTIQMSNASKAMVYGKFGHYGEWLCCCRSLFLVLFFHTPSVPLVSPFQIPFLFPHQVLILGFV